MSAHKKSLFRRQRAVWEGQTPPALLCEACGAVSAQPSLPHAAETRAQVKFQVLSNPSTLLHRTAQISAANKQDQWDSARKSPRTYFSSCYAIPPEKIQKQIKKKKLRQDGEPEGIVTKELGDFFQRFRAKEMQQESCKTAHGHNTDTRFAAVLRGGVFFFFFFCLRAAGHAALIHCKLPRAQQCAPPLRSPQLWSRGL